MPYARLAVPVALGLSLATVTALVFYYVLKKDENETQGRIKSSRVNTIEVSVPKSIVPALIGRGGSNIKDIEKKTGAMIHFKKFNDKDYDVCIIKGSSDATQVAETKIHDFIKNQPVIVEENTTVPAWACGRIIGSGGETINTISHRSGARVKLEGSSSDAGALRQVCFKGTTEQIKMAKRLVEECVAQEKCRREVEQSRRSPRHSHPSASPTPSNKSITESANSMQESANSIHQSANSTTESTEMPGDASLVKHEKCKKSEVSGSAIEVYVSAVSTPSRFWVQFVGHQVAQLDELVNTMTQYYSNKDNREAHSLSTVSVGMVVAAVFRHDGRWYRARVQDIRPNEYDPSQEVADVFFVDYGDSEYVATHELCELRADLFRLRFQAMECFLSGVSPLQVEQDPSLGYEKWNPLAVERFEDLTQVARWKPLLSKTCSYKRSVELSDSTKEIPGIKLYDVSDGNEVDIAAVLISEGWAEVRRVPPPPPPPAHSEGGFGDLGHSRVLSISPEHARSSSVPKELADKDPVMASSKSLGSELGNATQNQRQPSPIDLTYPAPLDKVHLNGSQNNFLQMERDDLQSTETLTDEPMTPVLQRIREESKANMNRVDSHHGNLDALGHK